MATGNQMTTNTLPSGLFGSGGSSLFGKQDKASGIQNTSGFGNMMNNPIMASIMAKGKPKNSSSMGDMDTSPKTKSKRDPNISTVPPNSIQALRKNDSEADILAKMLNLYKHEQDGELKRYRDSKNEKKTLKDRHAEEFKAWEDVLKGKDDKKPKDKTKSFGSSSLLKFAMIGGAGLLLSQKAFASEVEGPTKEFSSSIKDTLKSIFKVFGAEPNMKEMSTGPLSGNEADAKKSAEQYLGRAISSKEWDELLRATAAEASMNQQEEALVMGSILNRARDTGKGEGSIHEVLYKPYQFQAVTGTKKNNHQPSEKYVRGPGETEKASIFSGVTQHLQNVRPDQKDFISAKREAFGPGTNPKRLDEAIARNDYRYGNSLFPKGFINNATPVAMETPKPEIPVSLKKPKPKAKSVIVVQNNNNNYLQGDTNINTTTVYDSDKSPLIDQQYYRK